MTARENLMRGQTRAAANAAKTSCIHGHPFDDVNTYLDNRGQRGCRTCRNEASRRYRAKHGGTR